MNKNIEYELLTQQIYQGLLDEEKLTVDVEHNINLQGKSTKHQIDVYWEYKIAGVLHKVAIECKNYSKKISIGKIRDFNSVLNDIGGLNGLMVTKIGFQKGAIAFAKANGIQLVVLRDPIEEDWTDRIRVSSTTVEAISTYVVKRKFDLDLLWMQNKFSKEALKNFEFRLSIINNEIWFFDQDGEKVRDLAGIEDYLPIVEGNTTNIVHYEPLHNYFIETENYGKLKINGVEFTYNISKSISKFESDGSKLIKTIVKNVLTDEIKFIRK